MSTQLFHHDIEFTVTEGTETSTSLGDKMDILFDAIYEEIGTDALLVATHGAGNGSVFLSSKTDNPDNAVEMVKKHLALAGIDASSVTFSETYAVES